MCPRATKRSQSPAAAARGEPAARPRIHQEAAVNGAGARAPSGAAGVSVELSWESVFPCGTEKISKISATL